MPAGFQSLADGIHTQLTNEDVYFTLSAKGVISGVWSQEGNNSGFVDIVLSGYSLADVPMFALKSASGTWSTLIADTASSLTYRVFRVGGADVNYFLFTNRSPSPNASKAGIELYKPNGQLVFASDTLIARPMGIFSGNLFGSSSYSGQPLAGKEIAHVPMKQGTYSYQNDVYGNLGSCLLPGGINGYSLTRTTGWQRSAVSVGVGSVSHAPRFSQVTLGNMFCSSVFTPNTNSSGGALSYSSLILDVTNY